VSESHAFWRGVVYAAGMCAWAKQFSFKAWPDKQANLDDAFANPFDAMCGWKAKYWPQRRLALNY
jgi:hypothetical protein